MSTVHTVGCPEQAYGNLYSFHNLLNPGYHNIIILAKAGN